MKCYYQYECIVKGWHNFLVCGTHTHIDIARQVHRCFAYHGSSVCVDYQYEGKIPWSTISVTHNHRTIEVGQLICPPGVLLFFCFFLPYPLKRNVSFDCMPREVTVGVISVPHRDLFASSYLSSFCCSLRLLTLSPPKIWSALNLHFHRLILIGSNCWKEQNIVQKAWSQLLEEY